MEKDLDKNLYQNYLNGEKEAFEALYKQYKSKIEYFIYHIVKDYQKAEDLTQETFLYVAQNEMKKACSFKYFIYLVAKSKAFNYIKVENRRNEIKDLHFVNNKEPMEKDVLEVIEQEESKRELLEAIELLEEKYKNAIYLVKIEGLSYEETSQILGETLQNTKNLIHRGKKLLRKILLKKGFEEMNKVSKVLLIVISMSVILSGIVYAATVIYKNFNTSHHVTMNPTYQSTLDEKTINNLWVGTLDLAWKELEERLGKDKIELEDENLQIVDDLNASAFSKEMLDSNDYEIKVERTGTNGYKIDAALNKELNFLEVFDNFSNDYKWTFGDGENISSILASIMQVLRQ